MAFENIIGQTEITGLLEKSVVEGLVGHAYIFSGPKGIGKKSVARSFSELLLCNAPNGGQPCGRCTSCLLLKEGAHPDYREISPEGKTTGIDEIRDLQSDAVVKPMYSSRKVYLITEAESMTAQAQNCLLKILEEPPGYLVFILTTSGYDSLLETVKSRGVKYSFKKNTREEVAGFLKNRFGAETADADFIASLSGGVIGLAVDLYSSEDYTGIRDGAVQLVFKLPDSQPEYIFEAGKYFEDNKASADTILETMLLILRDLMVYAETGNENLLINSDKKDIILRNAARFKLPQLINQIEAVETARRSIKRNINFQLSIEVMLMKLQEEFNRW